VLTAVAVAAAAVVESRWLLCNARGCGGGKAKAGPKMYL
jgi:hypothetical protein